MNKNLVWILGGCAVVLLICCIGTVALALVFQSQVQEIVAGLSSNNPSIPSVPNPTVSGITPVVPGVVPTAIVPAKTSSSAASSAVSSVAPTGSNPFADALKKANSATKYRMQFTMIVGGTTNGKYAEETLFDMSGEVDGKSMRMSSKGGFLAILSGDPNGTVEFLTADNKTYMRGVKMFGMTDPKLWYVTSDNSTSSGMGDFAKPDAFNDFVDNPSSFKKVGNEVVDGQACDIWAGTVSGFDAAGMTGIFGAGKDTGDLGVVDKAETRVWLCNDGYVHKFAMDYQGHNAKTPTEKGAFKINGKMWDYNNAAIKVTPPTDAKPLPGGKP